MEVPADIIKPHPLVLARIKELIIEHKRPINELRDEYIWEIYERMYRKNNNPLSVHNVDQLFLYVHDEMWATVHLHKIIRTYLENIYEVVTDSQVTARVQYYRTLYPKFCTIELLRYIYTNSDIAQMLMTQQVEPQRMESRLSRMRKLVQQIFYTICH